MAIRAIACPGERSARVIKFSKSEILDPIQIYYKNLNNEVGCKDWIERQKQAQTKGFDAAKPKHEETEENSSHFNSVGG